MGIFQGTFCSMYLIGNGFLKINISLYFKITILACTLFRLFFSIFIILLFLF